MLERYYFSIACRFWNISPWEMEGRADAGYWIAEALTMRSAENLGESIANDVAMKKAKSGK